MQGASRRLFLVTICVAAFVACLGIYARFPVREARRRALLEAYRQPAIQAPAQGATVLRSELQATSTSLESSDDGEGGSASNLAAAAPATEPAELPVLPPGLDRNATLRETFLKLTRLYLPPNRLPGHLNSNATQARICAAFQQAPPGAAFALVGNGPLSAADRAAINSSDVIVRFNNVDNMLAGERLDIWVINSYGVRLEVFNSSRAAELAAQACTVLVSIYERKNNAEEVRRRLGHSNLIGVQYRWKDPLSVAIMEALHLKRVLLSTGFGTLNWMLNCIPADDGSSIHLHGFNWQMRDDTAEFHHGNVEGTIIQLATRLLPPGRLVVHATECNAFRSCAS